MKWMMGRSDEEEQMDETEVELAFLKNLDEAFSLVRSGKPAYDVLAVAKGSNANLLVTGKAPDSAWQADLLLFAISELIDNPYRPQEPEALESVGHRLATEWFGLAERDEERGRLVFFQAWNDNFVSIVRECGGQLPPEVRGQK
jgi:hypothetical protein